MDAAVTYPICATAHDIETCLMDQNDRISTYDAWDSIEDIANLWINKLEIQFRNWKNDIINNPKKL